MKQLNGYHETFEAQFIKLIISGDMPIGPESHQDSWIAISNYFWTVIVKDPVNYIDKHVTKLSKEKSVWLFAQRMLESIAQLRLCRLLGCCLYPNFLVHLGNILSLDVPFRLSIT